MDKKEYVSPHVIRIHLDNTISLALESEPPVFESKNEDGSPEFFNNEAFKNTIS